MGSSGLIAAGLIPQRFSGLRSAVATPGTKQFVRYAVAGFGVTQFAAGVYASFAVVLHFNAFVANCLSTVSGLAVGYWTHSRWSFAAQPGGDDLFQLPRFLVASALAFVLNSAWVWLLVSACRLPALAPVPLMMLVTPWMSFLLNRHWVFRR
jgi:putative flippase GtrA